MSCLCFAKANVNVHVNASVKASRPIPIPIPIPTGGGSFLPPFLFMPPLCPCALPPSGPRPSASGPPALRPPVSLPRRGGEDPLPYFLYHFVIRSHPSQGFLGLTGLGNMFLLCFRMPKPVFCCLAMLRFPPISSTSCICFLAPCPSAVWMHQWVHSWKYHFSGYEYP